MKKENLSSKVRRLLRCRNSEDGWICSGCQQCCCSWCWWLSKPKKPDIQFVLSRSEFPPEKGYDNEACLDDSKNDLISNIYKKIEVRRHNSVCITPLIDMRPIQFWAAQTSTQNIQPREARLGNPTQPPISGQSGAGNSLQPHLYEVLSQDDKTSSYDIPDHEKLERFGLGQLHLALQYELATWTLTVRIIEARDLPRPDRNKADNPAEQLHSNPYVKICLLPDHKNARQTSIRRKTQNPKFEETFSFEMSFHEAQRRTLQIRMMDFDKYSRHCTIGEILLPLATINLVKGIHIWKALSPCEKDLAELGELLLSLNYLPSAGRLNVDVIKAKQLLQTDMQGGSAPYVRISMVHGDKLIKTKKTSAQKNTNDPIFNESFSYALNQANLEEMSLVATAWHSRPGLSKDTFIGRVVLGKEASGPNQMTHWQRMIKSQRSAVAQWHSLQTREECDQVSLPSRIVP